MCNYKKLSKDPELVKEVCQKLPYFLKTLRIAYAALAAPTDQKMLAAKKHLEASTKILEDWGCEE